MSGTAMLLVFLAGCLVGHATTKIIWWGRIHKALQEALALRDSTLKMLLLIKGMSDHMSTKLRRTLEDLEEREKALGEQIHGNQ